MKDKNIEDIDKEKNNIEPEKMEEPSENSVLDENKNNDEKKSFQEIGIEIIDVDDEYEKEKEPKTVFGRISRKIKKWKQNKVVGILWQLVSSILLLALAGGIGIFAAVGQMRGGPKVFADEYFGYFMNNNWYNMYQKTEITESKFINLTTFSRMMSQMALDGDVTDYEIVVDSRSGDYATVRAKYTMNKEAETLEEQETTAALTDTPEQETAAEVVVDGEAVEGVVEEVYVEEVTNPAEETTQEESTEPATVEVDGTYTMTLKKQPERVLLVFTTWKGSVDNYIIKNCTIEAPDYVKVTFDGIDISDCVTGTNEETGNIVYTLDRIFMGQHTIKIEGDTIDTITENVLWEKNNEKYEFAQDMIPIKTEYRQAMQNKSLEILQACYASGLTDGNTDAIKPLLRESEEAYAHIDEQINVLYNEINHEDGRTLINMEITSLTYELTDFVYNDSVRVNMIYNVNYTAKEGRTVISGHRKTYTGSNTAIAAVDFKYIDGEWQAVDMIVNCVDYTLQAE